ncbi:bifunctional metallophosphatase/5'-nucleotidase [Segniliparus rugosus]|uniref:5'-nucleotidase n=1 Tax=Segniliparus rugosus (strain ATCC BAA-974 / DSM 45345 / CCUG 50838 / CIP 108380 / JCM 13579 / CDC 945) TaxID=679197 RepID=E5XPM2_SEGRC|nr:bifunctional UDP-sugar hydrolase/5'-nucleotidase [Segniliparus rugosus]EFV13709.2 hypothetical protein HMPREF9336_01444 [Segniliparus rugosus ATCC BAA-974]
MRFSRARGALFGAMLMVLVLAVGAALWTRGRSAEEGVVAIRLIALNDFHGNLEPPTGGNGVIALADGKTVPAGGAVYLATRLRQLRASAPHSLVLASGDNVGASPTVSALSHDEPTIEFFNQLGVQASVVGNHEFDHGFAELSRLSHGGCSPKDGCVFDERFPGAKFPYLGANVTFDSGEPALPASTVLSVGGVRVGVIGVTLRGVPEVTSQEAVKGLRFGDEVTAIDRSAKDLDAQGVKAIVVLMHQGDPAQGGPNDCRLSPGPAAGIAERASPLVDAVFTGHSHQQYNCMVKDPAGDPRPVIQGESFGRLLSVVDLKIDRATGEVLRAQTKAENEVVARDVAPDPDAAALVAKAEEKSAGVASRPVGHILADLSVEPDGSGQSSLGSVVADAQLAATRGAGAQVALTNPRGVRADVVRDARNGGAVTYGAAFAAQPFANQLETLTLTGAGLKAVLEQQWQGERAQILQVSASLSYRWSRSAPDGSKVADLRVNGAPVDPDREYRVTTNNFLAFGGDGFTEFEKGTEATAGGGDLDALVEYFQQHDPLPVPAGGRIVAVG